LYLFIIPTYGCNLKCTYCFEKKDRENKLFANDLINVYDKEVEFDIDNFFNYLKNTYQIESKEVISASTIKFHGGEPTLLPAEDILYLSKLWKEKYKQKFNIKKNIVYTNIVTNGIKIITNEDYFNTLLKDEEINLSMGLSFDLYSQSTRSPSVSYKEFEKFFDKIFEDETLKKRVKIGLLILVSEHSLLNEKEWFEYLEYFIAKYSLKFDDAHIRITDNLNINNKHSYRKFLQKIAKLENKMALKGKLIPFDLYESELHGNNFSICSDYNPLCFANKKNNLVMINYYKNRFWFGCEGKNFDKELSFKTFDEIPQIIENFNKKAYNAKKEVCKDCEFINFCSPCPIMLNSRSFIYNGTDCKKIVKRNLENKC